MPKNTGKGYHSESDSDPEHISSASSVDDELATKQNGHPKESFYNRVSSIPLIYDSVTTLHSYAKDNKIGRFALDTAGNAVETVNKITEPVQKRLQPHLQPTIAKVDQLAVKSLDLVQGTFPIVTKPTSEIVTTVKKPIVYVEESSKTAYNNVHNAIDTHVTTPVKSVASSVATTATTTVNKVASTAASTRDSITSSATETATNIASKVNTHATPLVNGLETIVDRYLPADSDNEKTPQGQSNQASRVADIGRTVSRRVSRRVSIAVAPVTQSPVVVKSKDQLTVLSTRLDSLLKALREHSKELAEHVKKAPHEASHSVHVRVSELSNKVLTELGNLSEFLKEHSPSLPESVQTRLQPLITFVNDRYAVVKAELSKKDVSAIQKARNILQSTTDETLPILMNATQDVKAALHGYQLKAQESAHKGYVKVQEVHSNVNLYIAKAYHSVHVILVGK